MESHRLLLMLSAVSLALSVLALAMALAFVNPWREPECPGAQQFIQFSTQTE